MTTEHTQLIRGLGLIAAISVNVGNIIGTGVFLKARVMTCNVGTPGKALIVWVVAGLLAMAGALTYAELLAMKPRAAGEYGIVRDAYGRPMGFIYGWTQFLIARTASAAALAVGFAIFLNDLVGGALKHPYFEYTLPGGHVISFGRLQLVALTAIIVTTVINCAAVRVSGECCQRAHRHEDRRVDWLSVSAHSSTVAAIGAILPWRIRAVLVKAWLSRPAESLDLLRQ